MTFQIIFAEILSKKIKEEKVFAYTAMRLREIGAEVQKIVSFISCLKLMLKQKKKSEAKAEEMGSGSEEDESDD